MPNNFELLPNEILLEIFKYTRAVDACRGFHQLNHRIECVLRSVPLRVNLSVHANDDLHVILPFAMQVSCQRESICFQYCRPKVNVKWFGDMNILDGHLQLCRNFFYLSKNLLGSKIDREFHIFSEEFVLRSIFISLHNSVHWIDQSCSFLKPVKIFANWSY